jgi:hypothetical protein
MVDGRYKEDGGNHKEEVIGESWREQGVKELGLHAVQRAFRKTSRVVIITCSKLMDKLQCCRV